MPGVPFPEFVYEKYRDILAQRPPEHLYFTEQVGPVAAAALSTADFFVPVHLDAIFSGFSISLTPGAAQSIVQCRISILTPMGRTYSFPVCGTFAVASTQVIFLPPGLYLEAGTRFTIIANFNAGVANNQLNFLAIGCAFPKLNRY